MNILVTGGAGFIGSAVIRQAIAQGHSVMNVDALTYAGCLDNLTSVANSPLYQFSQVDIRDPAALAEVFGRYRPNAVLHLAAESHVDRSIDGPRAFIETNIVGTYNLLEAARALWMAEGRPDSFRFHHVSTDEVYGSLGPDGAFTETTAYAPNSPYSASKAASDHLVKAWHSTYGLPILLTNCSNNYGPFQYPEKLIPTVIMNAIENRPIPVYGTGENVRDWLFVEDHADALLTVLARGKVGRSYNIGGGTEASNLDLVRMVCATLDQARPRTSAYGDLITFVTDRPGHDFRYAIDPSRMRDELGWAPRTALAEGLRQTVQWYLDNEAWWSRLRGAKHVGQRLGLSA